MPILRHAVVALGLLLALTAPATPATAGPIDDADKLGEYTAEVALLEPLAQQGNADAEFLLGNIYGTGKGIAQDQQAVAWFRKGADQGDAPAQYSLGLLYDNGSGVAQDYAQAAKWYRKAAEQGHASAQYNLGNMYRNGYGVPQDYAQAVKWYRKAADQGHAGALGLGHMPGRPVPDDGVAVICRGPRCLGQQPACTTCVP